MPWTREGGWVMFRSLSTPELGKGSNPLRGYTGDARVSLSIEEEEAERLYYSLCSASLSKKTFAILAKDLSRRSSNAGAYLTWLIYRGQKWPEVRGAEIAAAAGHHIVNESITGIAIPSTT